MKWCVQLFPRKNGLKFLLQRAVYTAKPISECRLASSWSTFYGTTSLEHLSWNAIHGTLSMEHFSWNTFYGTHFMEHFSWNAFYGTLMERLPCNTFHGTPSMERLPWNTFYGTPSMERIPLHSVQFQKRYRRTDGRTDVHTKIPGGPTSTEIGTTTLATELKLIFRSFYAA